MRYEAKTFATFCSAKDTNHRLKKPNVICCLTCPACNKNYIGKTDRNLFTRLHDRGSRSNQPMHKLYKNI